MCYLDIYICTFFVYMCVCLSLYGSMCLLHSDVTLSLVDTELMLLFVGLECFIS